MSNVPKLRFKEFSGEWKKNLLGKYGNLINGLTYSPNDIVDDGLLVLRSSNIQNNQMSYKDNVYVNLSVKDEALTVEDDILICVRNGSKRLIGKNVLIPFNIPNATHGAFMTIFRGDSNKFVAQWFKSEMFFKQVHMNLGATINSINGSDLKKFKVIFPDKQEQEKIATFLTSVDTKIEQLSRKEELLKEYKKGVMQKIFSGELRFKADNSSEFCEWEEKKLKELTTKQSSNISANTLEENIGQYKIYGATGHLKNVDFYMEENPYISIIKDGAGVGRVLLCDGQSSVLGTLDIIKNNNSMNLYYIYLLLSRIHFEKYVVGSTIPHIYYKDYSNEKVNVPCLEEQTKIANFLSSIDMKIEQVHKQLDYTTVFTKALLQQMFV